MAQPIEIQDRLVTVGLDTLLPHELRAEEINFLLNLVNRLVPPADQREFNLYRRPLIKKVETLARQSPERIPILSLMETAFSEDVDIFDKDDSACISLYSPFSDKAEKNLKFWVERFRKEKGTVPTAQEKERYLKPGFQLQVLGHDSSLISQLEQELQQAGFPIAPYRGLSEESDEKPKKITQAMKNGLPGTLYKNLLDQLTPAVITVLVQSNQIDKKTAAEIIRDLSKKRDYVFKLVKSELKRRYEESYPLADPDQIEAMIKEYDIYNIQ